MRRPRRFLRSLAWVCFFFFIACGLVSAATGVLLIWRPHDVRYAGYLWLTFTSAFLLTVISGLFVSGTRSMLGIIEGDRGS